MERVVLHVVHVMALIMFQGCVESSRVFRVEY